MKKDFSGYHFWGVGFLPRMMGVDLNSVREWALKNGSIFDEGQVMTKERAAEILGRFSPEEEIFILSEISEGYDGKLIYIEYPFLSLKNLIQSGREIKLAWWKIQLPEKNKNSIERVRFGFFIDDCLEEFVSESMAKIVNEKFLIEFEKNKQQYNGEEKIEKGWVMPMGPVQKEITTNLLDIEVNGKIKAKFFKVGHSFNIEFIESRI